MAWSSARRGAGGGQAGFDQLSSGPWVRSPADGSKALMVKADRTSPGAREGSDTLTGTRKMRLTIEA